jgi:hypothetical protein
VQAKDIDAAFRRRRDEAARKVRTDGPRADEESPAEGHRKRGLRPCLERPDPLPGALDPAPDGAVEDAAAGDLEVCEAGAVQCLGELEQIRGRHPTGERLLGQESNRRVDERGH